MNRSGWLRQPLGCATCPWGPPADVGRRSAPRAGPHAGPPAGSPPLEHENDSEHKRSNNKLDYI